MTMNDAAATQTPLIKRTPETEATLARAAAEEHVALRQELERVSSQRIALPKLHESPFNKRRTWGDLNELAKTIEGVGILQDLVARPHPKKPGEFELVFGHRRLRAGKIAKVADAPVKVRELSDDQVVELQAIENLQRTDIHPIEEAETFELLREKQHLTVDQLAARIGKSTAYVYASLKYLDLGSEGRKAFADNVLSKSVALYIARMPAPLQAKALKEVTKKDYQGDIPSAREAFEIVQRRFMLKLAEAPFDRGDAQLVPKAGACTVCPQRTGNHTELFADVGSADVCTNPPCFEKKCEAHTRAKATELETKGTKVLPGKIVDYGHGQRHVYAPEGFQRLSEPLHESGLYGTKAYGKALSSTLNGKKVELEKIVFFDDTGKAVPLVAKAKIPGLLKAAGIKRKVESVQRYKAKPATHDKILDAQEAALLEAVTKHGVKDALLRYAVHGLVFGAQKKEVAKLTGNRLAAMVAKVLLHYYTGDIEQNLGLLAKSYGVDLKKIEKEVLAKAATPAASIPAKAIAKAAAAAKKKASTKGRKK